MARSDKKPTLDEVQWFEEHSMLHAATELARAHSGSQGLWERAFGERRSQKAVATASVWFTAYPAATLTAPGQSVLATLGSEDLWRHFAQIGIDGIHTGPMKLAGGLDHQTFTPSVDGHFDRIGFDIDPGFGSLAEYHALVETAAQHGAVIIGDVIPGHTGKGADFRLAELKHGDYPGLYHMVAIEPEDWALLPAVPADSDAVNLPTDTVDALAARGYIAGRLPRVLLAEPGIKQSNWSATHEVVGVDGVRRRWVYLHYFKEGQPTLNWIDPSFAAARLVFGDCLHALGKLGLKMLRFDANGFLGLERTAQGQPVWSEGHPLSLTANQLLASWVRKLGGFSFQELNLALDDLRAMQQGGADLSYDFVSRPAYHHALVCGDTSFLRLMYELMDEFFVEPGSLVHALQNHDELTLELVHFWRRYGKERFRLGGVELDGLALRERIRTDMKAGVLRGPYNLEAANGIACTTASLIAATLGITDCHAISSREAVEIRRGHLLLAFFNAMQPGVMALSGWDLVGALTLPRHQVERRLADGDTRWINRGAYDLLGVVEAEQAEASGLPRATTLYGPLPAQLEDPDSFASSLAGLLATRRQWRIAEAKLGPLPPAQAPGLFVMSQVLPEGTGLAVTALNFSRNVVAEDVCLSDPPSGVARDILGQGELSHLDARGRLRVELGPWETKAWVIAG